MENILDSYTFIISQCHLRKFHSLLKKLKLFRTILRKNLFKMTDFVLQCISKINKYTILDQFSFVLCLHFRGKGINKHYSFFQLTVHEYMEKTILHTCNISRQKPVSWVTTKTSQKQEILPTLSPLSFYNEIQMASLTRNRNQTLPTELCYLALQIFRILASICRLDTPYSPG